MAHQQPGLAVVGDGGGRVDPEPGGLLAAEDVLGVVGVVALVLGEPEERVGAQRGFGEDGADLGFGGGADDAQRLEGQSAQQGVLARATASSSATALPTVRAASQARYSSRAGPGVSRAQPRSMSAADCSMLPAGLWAATQICSSLTQTAQLPRG